MHRKDFEHQRFVYVEFVNVIDSIPPKPILKQTRIIIKKIQNQKFKEAVSAPDFFQGSLKLTEATRRGFLWFFLKTVMDIHYKSDNLRFFLTFCVQRDKNASLL